MIQIQRKQTQVTESMCQAPEQAKPSLCPSLAGSVWAVSLRCFGGCGEPGASPARAHSCGVDTSPLTSSQLLPGQICPCHQRVCSANAGCGPLGSRGQQTQGAGNAPSGSAGWWRFWGAGLVVVGRGWCLLTCRRLLGNTRSPSLSLKRYLEAEMAYEKIKCIQPSTEGERKGEQIAGPKTSSTCRRLSTCI